MRSLCPALLAVACACATPPVEGDGPSLEPDGGGGGGAEHDGGTVTAGDGGGIARDGGTAPDDGGASGLDDAGSAGDDDAGATPPGRGRYDLSGPESFTTHTLTVDGAGLGFDVDVYLPGTPGPRPVVSLSPGLMQPRAGYTPYGERLASHGILTVVRDDPGILTSTPAVADDIALIVSTWLAEENDDAGSPLYQRVDLGRVGLAGHSRGGKASLIAAETVLAGVADAWFGLDPVDSATLGDGVLARDALPDVGIPTGFVGAEIASSCSPEADSYEVLFAAAPSPSVSVTGIGAGHVQLQHPDQCTGCSLCSPGGTADHETVLAYSVRYLTAFFARELNGDDTVGAAFEGAGAALDIAAGQVAITAK